MIVKFPAAAEASGANVDMIHEYQITLTDSEGNQTVRKVFADYYKEPRKTDWSVKVADLTGETTYSVAVTAVTSFGAASAPITAAEDVTTGAGYKPVYPAEAILDVDFSKDATGADAKIENPSIEVSVSGETRVNLEDSEVPFLFSMNNMERVAATTLTFEVSDKTLVIDGVVDLLDIAHAQKYYQLNSNSANWEQAKNCDVTGDSMIDLEDLIAILRAYAAPLRYCLPVVY